MWWKFIILFISFLSKSFLFRLKWAARNSAKIVTTFNNCAVFCSSNSQKTAYCNTEWDQFLCKPFAVRAIKTSLHIRQEFVKSIVQCLLVFWWLCADQMILIGCEAWFTGQHQTEHWLYHGPMMLRSPKQQEVEESRRQARKQIWLSGKMLGVQWSV